MPSLTPLEQKHYVGDLVPLGFQGAWLIYEPMVLDSYEIFGNPDHDLNPLTLELRTCHGEERIDDARPVLRMELTYWRTGKITAPDDGWLEVYLPVGTFLGLWVISADTDYYLFAPHVRAPSLPVTTRVPLPGEGETYEHDGDA